MEVSWMSVLFGAFGLGFIKLLWEAISYFITRHDNKKTAKQIFSEKQAEIENLFNDLIEGAVTIQEYIEEFIVEHGASRVLLFKLENGGGTPQLGTVQHISVLNEAIHPSIKHPDGEITSVKHDLQNYVIDSEYQRMLLKMMADKIFIANTGDLENGILKNIHESSHIRKAIITPVTKIPSLDIESSKGFMIYMSIEFMDERVIDSKLEYGYIILKDKIRQIFHEFYIKRIMVFDK